MPFEEREKNYLKMPKVGESYDFSQHGKITEIKKVDNPDHKLSKFNFTQKKMEIMYDALGNKVEVPKTEDLGYFYKLTFTDGKVLQISAWQPFYALTEAKVIEGDLIVVNHPEKGSWKVTKK